VHINQETFLKESKAELTLISVPVRPIHPVPAKNRLSIRRLDHTEKKPRGTPSAFSLAPHSGNTLAEAVSMAEEALGLHLSSLEEDGEPLPSATPLKQLEAPERSSIVLIKVNTDSFKEAG
jgi:predicted RNase H-like HicB family nuclease